MTFDIHVIAIHFNNEVTCFHYIHYKNNNDNNYKIGCRQKLWKLMVFNTMYHMNHNCQFVQWSHTNTCHSDISGGHTHFVQSVVNDPSTPMTGWHTFYEIEFNECIQSAYNVQIKRSTGICKKLSSQTKLIASISGAQNAVAALFYSFVAIGYYIS